MNVNDHLHRAILTEARARRTPWYEIVRAIQKLQSLALHDEHGRPWIAYAQDVSGYNYIQLREMIRTYDTVEWLASRLTMSTSAILARFPKHNIEIVSRIKKISEDSAIEVFNRMTKETLTVSALREIYDEIKSDKNSIHSSVSVGKQLSNDFEHNCLSIIKENRDEAYMCFDYQIDGSRPISCKMLQLPGRHGYISPSFVFISEYKENMRYVAAMDCAFTSIENDDRIARRLKDACFDATYFSLFYVLIPSWADHRRIYRIMDTLQIKNVGIILIDLDEKSMSGRDTYPLTFTEAPCRTLKSNKDLILEAIKRGEELVPPEMGAELASFVP